MTISEVGGCLSLRAQPGNRLVSFVRGVTRREIITPLGLVRSNVVPSPRRPVWRSGLAWLGLAAPAPVHLCAWLLAFGFPAPPAPAPAPAPARLCAWLLALVLVFGFWLLVVRCLARYIYR